MREQARELSAALRYRELAATSLEDGPAARRVLQEIAEVANAAAERGAAAAAEARAAILAQDGTRTGVCRVCGREFPKIPLRRVFCSPACRRKQQREYERQGRDRRARKEREQSL
jgi:hypothetical protein